MRKALSVGRKEIRQILRDRRSLAILLFVPAFFLLIYGYALNFDIRHVALGVDDRDQTTTSRALIASFANSGYFDIVSSVRSEADITRAMDEGTVRAILVIPPRLAADIQSGLTV